jgi:hypothetical protein
MVTCATSEPAPDVAEPRPGTGPRAALLLAAASQARASAATVLTARVAGAVIAAVWAGCKAHASLGTWHCDAQECRGLGGRVRNPRWEPVMGDHPGDDPVSFFQSGSLGRPVQSFPFPADSGIGDARATHWQGPRAPGHGPPDPDPDPDPRFAGDRGWGSHPRFAGDRGSIPTAIPDLPRPGIGGPSPPPPPSPICRQIAGDRGSTPTAIPDFKLPELPGI